MRKLTFFNLFLLLILCPLSMSVGVADFHWGELFSQSEQSQLFFISRLPRTLAVILVGATLSVAGILIASLWFPAMPLIFKMSFATVTALIGMAIFMLLMRNLPPHQKLMLPLVGIIFGNIIEAVTTFIAYETDSLQLLSVWFAGDFSGVLAGRYELLWLTAALAVIIYILADQLSIAGLGQNISTSLGINYHQMTWIALIIVAMITAVIVVTIGQIPFIGLVVPNIVSRLAGDRLRQNLPVVVLFGANLILMCDILGRVVNDPFEVPIFTIFGIVGTVIFLYLLFRGKKV